MSDFFKSQLDYIFFFYGAAFLLLIPICLFLQGRLKPTIAWTWLGCFGATHGLNEWLDLLALSLGSGFGFDLARLVLLAISFVLLAEFGRASMARMGGRVPGRWILVVMVGLAGLGGCAGVAGLFVATRYVLGFGGGGWAAGALFLAGRRVPLGSRQLKAAALGMTGYALASGLVPNHAPFFPAAWLNYDSFLAVTGFPIQLWRGVLAVWIAASLCLVALANLYSDRDRRFRSWFRYLLLATLTGLVILWIGGWFLTQYFGTVADRDMRDDYEHNVDVLRQAINEKMTETDNLVKFMTESPEISPVLTEKTLKNMEKVSSLLDRCSQTLEQSICYVMDPQGLTIASSNRNNPDSFVGKSYAFRPYFQQARKSSPGRYWALGITSKEMGYYASCAVRDQAGKIIGVVVVKRTIDEVKKVFSGRFPGLIIDPHGIVVMANHPDLVLRSLWPLPWQTQKQLLDSRQFGEGPFTPILDRPPSDGGECLFQSKRLRVLLQPGFWQDWSIVSLESMAPITQGRLLGISATVVLSMLLIGFLTIANIMRESEEGFRQLFENAVDILILHDKGRIAAVNQQACTSLGYTREELLRMSLFDIEVGIGKEDLITLWEQGGGLTTLAGVYRRQDGSTFPAEIRAGEISYRGQNLRLAAVRDVTERKRAEEALLESEKRFRDVAENAQEWVWEVDAEGKYTYASPIVEKLLGYKPEEILDKHFYDLFIPEEREKLKKIAFKAFAHKQPFREFINRNLHKDGSIVCFSTSGVAILGKTGNILGYRGADIDITERKKAEEALRQSQEGYRRLASQLMTVQETERQRLARELHDDLTQRLAVLAMEVEGLELQISNIPPAAGSAKLKEIREKLVKLSMDVHAISRQLHPSILDDLGLADAIASECAFFRQQHGITVNYQSTDLPRAVPKEIAINIYRISQEALRNISRHARATNVDIVLFGRDETLHLTIKDNGQGFDPQGKKMAGLGLASMKERVSLIGGDFSIQSWPEHGTVIEVKAPLFRRTA